jgi:hypothetical protein
MFAGLRVDGGVRSHGGLCAVCVVRMLSWREVGIMRSGAGDGWAIAIAIAIVKEIKATWVSQVLQAGSGDSRVFRVWDGLGKGFINYGPEQI